MHKILPYSLHTIAILTPYYNEAKIIEKVVTDFKSVLPETTIYVYDNNSKDQTDEIASKAGAIIRYERQQGKGNVICRMFQVCSRKLTLNAISWSMVMTHIQPKRLKRWRRRFSMII